MDSIKAGSTIETRYGELKILKMVGNGGMGKVFRAKDLTTNRLVAFKTTDNAFEVSEQDLLRFEAEAKAMQKLEHPNIVPFYYYGLYQNQLFIAMKFIEGKSLETLIQEKKSLGLQESIPFLLQIAQGLQYIHNCNIIHRDLKPSNVMIDAENRLYLSDFGISWMGGDSKHLTHTGMTMGTPEYMAPEQCQGAQVDYLADFYSFGILIYELLTGNPPFAGQKPLSIAWKQVHEDVDFSPLEKLAIPPALIDLIRQLLSKNKHQRPSDWSQIFQVLENLPLEVSAKAKYYPKIKQSKKPSQIRFASPLQTTTLLLTLALWIAWIISYSSSKTTFSYFDSENQNLSELKSPSQIWSPSLKPGTHSLSITLRFDKAVTLIGFALPKSTQLQQPLSGPRQLRVKNANTNSRKINVVTTSEYHYLNTPLGGKTFQIELLAQKNQQLLQINRLIPITIPME